MNDCLRFEELCSASVDGILTRTEKKELELHLKTCPSCQAYLEDLRAMRGLWRELDHPLPAGLHEKIMAAVQEEKAAQEETQKFVAEESEKVSVLVASPIPFFNRKYIRPMIGMLTAAVACLALVLSGGLANWIGVGGAADTAAPMAVLTTETSADAGVPMQQDAAASTAVVGSRMQTESALADAESVPVIVLPTALSGHSFSSIYLATGTGELPIIEQAVLLTTEGTRSYYSLPNDISVLESMMEELPGAGYTVVVTKSQGAGTENSEPQNDVGTEAVLLVVETK